MDSTIERLVQIGTVSAVDSGTHKVRVLFRNTGITSDWLPVLITTTSVRIESAGSHKHSGSVEIGNADGHSHGANLTINDAGSHMHHVLTGAWMPHVNDTVVCLFLPIENSDGFVIGGL